MEMLKLYSAGVKEEDLYEIKRMVGTYFAQKASEEADKVWNERGYTDEVMDRWLNDENQ